MRELTSRRRWRADEDEVLRKHYGPRSPHPRPPQRLAAELGRTVLATQRRAQALGLAMRRVTGPMRGDLTHRQWQMLRLIASHLLEFGRPPTIRWLGEAMGIRSPNGVVSILTPLERKGYVHLDHFEWGGIRLAGCKLTLSYDDDESGRRLAEALGDTP
jgi:hypothetical protein